MPVPVSQVGFDPERQEMIAVDVNGFLWHGALTTADDGQPVVDWTPLKGPPDGQHFTEAQKSFWDDMERKARELAKSSPNPDGTPLSLATEDEAVTGSTGGSVEDSPDDGVEDGEGDNTTDGSSQ